MLPSTPLGNGGRCSGRLGRKNLDRLSKEGPYDPENGVHDFDEASYTIPRRRKELYAISEKEEREKPLKARRAYRVELDRHFQLALSVPELQASNQRVFMDKGSSTVGSSR